MELYQLNQTQVDYLELHPNIPLWDEVPPGYQAPTSEVLMPDGVTHKFIATKALNMLRRLVPSSAEIEARFAFG
jgi:hypothetical protein